MKNIVCIMMIMALTACANYQQISDVKNTTMADPDKIKAGELLKQATTLYDKGDYQNALSAFTDADKAGHFKAKRYLGLMYLNGQGVAKNDQTAFEYFKSASENGDITAQYWLGVCYENGIGTKSDLNQAIFWYQKSAERGDHISQPAIDALKRLNIQ